MERDGQGGGASELITAVYQDPHTKIYNMAQGGHCVATSPFLDYKDGTVISWYSSYVDAVHAVQKVVSASQYENDNPAKRRRTNNWYGNSRK